MNTKLIIFVVIKFCFFNFTAYSQCGSCTNPTGNVTVGYGESICYDANTIISGLTVYFDGVVTVCDNVTLTISGASSFSGTGQIQLGNCSQLIIKGSFSGSVADGIVYTGDGSCHALVAIEGASTLGSSLTSDPEVHFCNVYNASSSGSSGAATVDCNLLLPVNLIDFSLTYRSSSLLLHWITLQEVNNDYFTIERSSDMMIWTPVKKVIGAGTSNIINKYMATDENPIFGISYYRLKQTDFDGRYTYYPKILTTTTETNKQNIRISTEYNILYIYSVNKIMEVELININGQIIRPKSISKNSFSLNNIPKGFYIMKTLIGHEVLLEKIIIK